MVVLYSRSNIIVTEENLHIHTTAITMKAMITLFLEIFIKQSYRITALKITMTQGHN